MKVIKEFPKKEFLTAFKSHRDFEYFSGRRTKYCYCVALTKREYLDLGMNSSPLVQYPEHGKFPHIKDTLKQYLKNPKLLNNAHPDRGISGVTVKKYLKKFKAGAVLKNCFITDEKAATGKSYYICEGMHRLVAYGLFKKGDIRNYEVRVYCHTNRKLKINDRSWI